MVTPSAIRASNRREGRIDQRLFTRRARRPHRREDSAAGPGNLVVARAAQAELELVRAIAGVDQVGMAVDQPRSDPAAGAVDALGRLEIRRVHPPAAPA